MPSTAFAKAQETARQLLLIEAGAEQSPLVCVWEKLRNHLGSLVGVAGFRTLLHRSLVIAQRRFGSLKKLSVADNGALVGFDEFATPLLPAQVKDASSALVGEVIVLLETFMGEELTRQLLEELWPQKKLASAPAELRKL